MRQTWVALVVAAVVIAIWQGLVWVTGVPHFILPGPLRVAAASWDNIEILGEHAFVTFIEIVLGLAFGTLLGTMTAIHLCLSMIARTFVLPILVLSQAIPVFAIAPILTLWLGYGLEPKILMTVLIVYFPITSACFDGLQATPHGYLDLARSMGASPTKVMFHVRIPAAIPSFATGLRLAAVYAPIGAIVGEWVGSSKGLGYLMLLASGRAKIDLMFAALAVLAVMTVVLRVLINRFCTYALGRWLPNSDVDPNSKNRTVH